MARIALNVSQETFDSAENRDFAPVPVGWHTVNIFEVTNKLSSAQAKNPGQPQLNVQFKIADGHDHANRRLFKLFNLFGETPFDTINFFKALGYTLEEVKSLDTDDLLGKELQVRVAHEVKQIKGEDGRYAKPADPKDYTYRENVNGFRSTEAGDTASTAKVAAGGTAKATASGAKFTL
jgi:hypothetical protein